MAAKNTTGTTGANAAALPNADLLRSIANLAGELDTLHGLLKHDVSPLLRAMENLTNCHRVLSGIECAANRDKGFGERITEAVQDWRDPTLEDPLELVGDLARVAVNVFTARQFEAEELVSRAYALANLTEGAAR
jgi:hypothetical protein